MADYLPPVVVRLKADIDDFMAKMAVAKAAMDDLGKSGGKSFKDMRKDMDTAFKDAEKDAKKAGDDAGKSFMQGWRDAISKSSTRARKDDASGVSDFVPYIGALLPMIPELTTAVMGAVGAFGSLGIAAGAGLGALAIALNASLKPILLAYHATGKAKIADIKALSPAQLHSYDLLTKFMQRLQNVGDKQGLQVFNKALSDAMPLLHQLGPLINTSANAVDHLLAAFGHDIKTAGFRSFMAELTKMAGPSIRMLGEAIGKIAVGIGNMVAAFGRSGVAMQAGRGLLDMLDKFDNWTGGQGMIDFLNKARQDMPLVARLAGSLLHVFTALFDSLGGEIGRAEIQVLTLLSEALAKLFRVPGIGPFLANMTALTLLFSKLGAVGLVTGTLKTFGKALLGLAFDSGKIKGAFAELKVAFTLFSELGTGQGLLAIGSALKGLAGAALGVVAPIAAAAAAIGGIYLLYRKFGQAAVPFTQHLQTITHAFGFNTKAIGNYSAALRTGMRTGVLYTEAIKGAGNGMAYTYRVNREANTAIRQANTAYRRQTHFVSQLATYLGISNRAAKNVAAGAKITGAAVDKGGKSYQNAMQKALAYANSIQYLNDAFNQLVQPQLSVIQGTVQFKQDSLDLSRAAKAAGDKVGYNTSAQRALAIQLATSITDAHNMSDAIAQQTNSNQKALGPLEKLYHQMERLHLHGALAAKEMQVLKSYIDQLKSKTINITTVFHNIGNPPPGGVPIGGGNRLINGESAHAVVASQSVENHVHVHLDGREIFKTVQSNTFRYNINNGNRRKGGNPAGVMAPH